MTTAKHRTQRPRRGRTCAPQLRAPAPSRCADQRRAALDRFGGRRRGCGAACVRDLPAASRRHVNRATEFAWLKVVVRNEALAVRRARAEAIPIDGDDLAARLPSDGIGVDERIERSERNARSLEALARLKADERTALLMAEGFSYREIGERHGWTYTKVNRADHRRATAFPETFASIDDGQRVRTVRATLLALVEGKASPQRSSSSARICVTAHPAAPRSASCSVARTPIALFLPFVAGIVPARWLVGASSSARTRRTGTGPGLRRRQGLLNRIHGSDVGTSLQMASSGGGRGTAVAALLSLCIGGGAGTYCLTSGALPDPVRILRPEETKAPKRERARKPAEPSRSEARGASRSGRDAPPSCGGRHAGTDAECDALDIHADEACEAREAGRAS